MAGLGYFVATEGISVSRFAGFLCAAAATVWLAVELDADRGDASEGEDAADAARALTPGLLLRRLALLGAFFIAGGLLGESVLIRSLGLGVALALVALLAMVVRVRPRRGRTRT